MNLPELHELIDRDFTYHPPPNESTTRAYELLRRQYRGLAHLLAELCPGSREFALAKTKLEESVMWANAAIARNGLREDAMGDGVLGEEGAVEAARRHSG